MKTNDITVVTGLAMGNIKKELDGHIKDYTLVKTPLIWDITNFMGYVAR